MFNPFSALTSKIFGGLSIGLLLALAVMGWKLHSANRKIENLQGWKTQVTLATRTAAHHPNLGEQAVAQQVLYLGAAIDEVQLKMAEARAKALADKAATEQRNDERKRNSDHALQNQAILDRQRGAEYKRSHRVPRPARPRDQSNNGRNDLPEPAFGPGVDNGPGPVAELDDPITIAGADFDTCTVNSRRLESAHLWAKP